MAICITPRNMGAACSENTGPQKGIFYSFSQLEFTIDATLPTQILDAIAANDPAQRLYPLTAMVTQIDMADSSPQTESRIYSDKVLFNKSGENQIAIDYLSTCKYASFVNLRGKTVYVYHASLFNYLGGVSNATRTSIKGRKATIQNVVELEANGSRSNKLVVSYSFDNIDADLPNRINALVDSATLDLFSVYGLDDVALAIGVTAQSGTNLYVKASNACSGNSYLGLDDSGAWVVLDSGGSPVTVTGVTYNSATEEYALAGTYVAGDYTVALAAPAALKALTESVLAEQYGADVTATVPI